MEGFKEKLYGNNFFHFGIIYFLETQTCTSHKAGMKGSRWWVGGLVAGPVAAEALWHEIHA